MHNKLPDFGLILKEVFESYIVKPDPYDGWFSLLHTKCNREIIDVSVTERTTMAFCEQSLLSIVKSIDAHETICPANIIF